MCHSHPFRDTFLFLIHGIQSHSLLDCSVTIATTVLQLHPRQLITLNIALILDTDFHYLINKNL